MGHYDEQRDYDDYQQNLRQDQGLIQDVRDGKFGVLLQAANVSNSQVVMVNRDTFSRMLNILSRLDPKTYSYPRDR
jgi:hypothetical protein